MALTGTTPGGFTWIARAAFTWFASGALRAVAAFTMLGGALRGMARHSP